MEEVQRQLKAIVSPSTPRGRAIRTGLQAFVAIGTFLTGLLTIPGLEQFLYDQGQVSTFGAFAIWASVISYVQNKVEQLIKYLWEE